ncbi:MAG: 3-dehydroquinate synthase, partial [Candidatus Margulisbacteria bacterium]|nr:3-dehydroquinate synthase [Candidatus Margulisiibacteriota bacterium]
FAASIYMRGINLIQVPTSLLAQVDAAIGGKTGVNHATAKNMIGSFYQPRLVWIDVHSLQSLPQKEIRSALAEIVKYGVIQHSDLFLQLEKTIKDIKPDRTYTQNPDIWIPLIFESASIKATVVSKDEKESDLREILNYGHTMGHALEALSHYHTYLHGEAIAIGMKGAALISKTLGIMSDTDYDRICTLLENLGFTLTIKKGMKSEDILDKMYTDKKVRNMRLRLVLPTAIGTVIVKDDVSDSVVIKAINALMH